MKYLEELSPGVLFCYGSEYWILTSDFKRNGSRMCIAIKNGFPSWLASDISVEEIDGYTIDNSSNLVKLRNHENTQTNNS
jgi:hypothetical protein